ncbi:MAG: Lrp/AsnC family transcriptional regulator [Alphaproteobacteria bacterium]|nr:Lrp/AsnC family transcriptional regulator [Alphaproteobacteria bacterium]
MIDLDAVDRRILTQLQQNNLVTNLELAKIAGISPPACLRRVRRLRQAGVIQGDVAVLDPAYAGRHMTALVEVTLERDRIDMVDNFKRAALAEAAVRQCYFVTGAPDFALVVQVPDVAAYEAFTRRFLYSNPDVAKFRTMVVLDPVKFEFRYDVLDEPAA